MTEDNKLSYGLDTCFDLHNKLIHEGSALDNNWTVYNSFNFIVTAWHLHDDWLDADWENRPKLATKKKHMPVTPANMMVAIYALRDIANSSKHFSLDAPSLKKKVVTDIHAPIIGDPAAYFFYGPMIYVETESSIYSMWDIRYIVLMYFDWIFDDNVPLLNFPVEIHEHLKRCAIKNQ